MDFDALMSGESSGDALKNQAARLALMSDVVLLISKTDDLPTLMSNAIAKIKWVIDFERCTLALLDEDGATYSLHTLIETRPEHEDADKLGVLIGRGLPGSVMSSGRVRLLRSEDELSDIDVIDHSMGLDDLESILCVPVGAYGRNLGALTFGSVRSGAYDKDAIDVVRTFAAHLALVLDRRRHLEQIGRTNSELMDEVARRKVAEEEASIARKAAEDANTAKSTFLANMSHELRTPLNAIIGYSEMLKEEAADLDLNNLLPDLDRILSAGKHLLSLINDILDLSKIEAGRMDIYIESFSIAGMISDVATTVQPLIAKNNNTLSVQIDEQLGSMEADLTKVRQILFNLLSNASKFTDGGNVTLNVCSSSKGGAEAVRFEVKDSGIGMTSEQVEKLFQAFQQADASTTRQYGGTGLGLAISRRFCELMGGHIEVDSELGKGSTFFFELPVSVVVEAEPSIHQADHDPKEGEGAPLVLVIDDDPVAQDLMRRFLEREGLRVETASNGEEGLAKAKAHHPNVITLDVLMPGMDGWAVLSHLKADPDVASIPVMMITIVDDKNLAFSLGASDYLTKPIDRNLLVSQLQKYRCRDGVCRVLVVEDDEGTRNQFRRVLEKDGWEIAEAENGVLGLQRLSENIPDVILLDLMMPEMDGFEFIEEVGINPSWSEIPIVVITAKDLSESDKDRLSGSVRRILEKHELSMEKLARHVRVSATSGSEE